VASEAVSLRVAISTGGGDAPGLNAVIRAAVLTGINHGWEMFGVERGFGGLLGEGRVLPLTGTAVRGITHQGGTILGTTNRGNPFRWPVRSAGGDPEEVDRSRDVLAAFEEHGLDALIVVGGDGSLSIARDLCRMGLPIVGVPKTIDNDVAGTLQTFGFDTAVNTASDAIGKLHSTAQSHSRVMVVEVMGRHAGWIALYAGIAGTADVILIPEIAYDIESVCEKVHQRDEAGRNFAIVVVAEGAKPRGGGETIAASGAPGAVARLGGVGAVVADLIEQKTGKETRWLALGHLQRGGAPTAFDRLLGLRFGNAAIHAVAEGRFGHMVAYTPPAVTTVTLDVALAHPKLVPLDSDCVRTARDLNVCLGD
jgi:ATP-dependent phosphofructokinase / diphosphate-dependent phosphofructokinase